MTSPLFVHLSLMCMYAHSTGPDPDPYQNVMDPIAQCTRQQAHMYEYM